MNIKTFLETTLQYPDQLLSWAVHEFPIDYTIIDPEERCSSQNIGNQVMSFDENLGYLNLPGNETSTWTDLELNLTGPNGLWGRSLVLTNGANNMKLCSSILPKENSDIVFTAEAKFRKGIAGNIYFRWLKSEAHGNDLLIYSTL